jgi:2-polyprenyl-6-methoxyphenol hydroxylase-like FAD-dependent oxidoreductase
MMQKSKVLISGAGIAGLTLAILLKEQGYQPLVVERDKAVRGEGYMMDFFGSGWDVAERMGLAPQLHAIRYPIDSLQFVDASGGIYTSVPIDRVRRALDDKYVYLRRSDLERILYERAIAAGVEIRFGSVITALQETANAVRTTFVDGTVAEFALVFGADGVHSGVRRLVFGETRQFERFLGGYVAAYHLDRHKFEIGRALKLYEETDRLAAFYPLDAQRMDATYVFRHDEVDILPEERLGFVRKEFKGAGWIAEAMLKAYKAAEPIYCHAALASGTRGAARRRLRLPHATGRPGFAYGDGGRLCDRARAATPRREFRGRLRRVRSQNQAGGYRAAD